MSCVYKYIIFLLVYSRSSIMLFEASMTNRLNVPEKFESVKVCWSTNFMKGLH